LSRRTRITGLVVLGILAYAVFLAVTVPLPVAWSWIGPRLTLRLYQPTGTLWSGGAAALVQGPRRLDAVRWTLHPSALMTLALGAHVSGRLPDGRVGGDVRVGPGNAVRVRDARADMDVDTLLSWAGRGGLGPFAGGHFDALLKALELRDGRLVSADGVINWNGAVIGPNDAIPLGDLALRLQPASGGGVNGKLVSNGGVLALDGDLALTPDGRFTLHADIAPARSGDPRARRVTGMLGLANPEGTTRVTISGNLNGGGLQIRQKAR